MRTKVEKFQVYSSDVDRKISLHIYNKFPSPCSQVFGGGGEGIEEPSEVQWAPDKLTPLNSLLTSFSERAAP
jgi:hypothetical protein